MPIDARKTLAGNVSWLLSNTEADSQPKLARLVKIDQKTISRIVNNANAATLDSVQALAEAFDLEPWQLLAPAFGDGLHTIKGTSIVPVSRPGAQPTAAKDALGIPHFNPPKPPQAVEPPTLTAKPNPRADKRLGGDAPKRGARVGR
jgi:hypothetical protein